MLADKYNLPTPFEPCTEGRRLFVSYAHDDQAVVFPQMTWLHRQGVRQWYDRGIPFGEKWWHVKVVAQLAEEECVGVLFFLSLQSIQRDQCYIELEEARRLGKNIYIVEMEDRIRERVEQLPDRYVRDKCNGFLAQFGGIHRIVRHEWRESDFPSHLLASLPAEVRGRPPPVRAMTEEVQQPEPEPRGPVMLEVGYFLGVRSPAEPQFLSLSSGAVVPRDSRFIALVSARVPCHAFLLIEELDAAGDRVGISSHWPHGWREHARGEPPQLEPQTWVAIPGDKKLLYETAPETITRWRIGLVASAQPLKGLLRDLDHWPGSQPFPDQHQDSDSGLRMPDITRQAYGLSRHANVRSVAAGRSQVLWCWTTVSFR